ncbi:F-box protein SKIP14-like [Olea europaea var. sylvestris]|uniref:F-box protein SKIP14-like n=1 Tax=Olea europaea var. sylvestris TaxID=158386 RepID=UPI000C1D82C9|nr:F-box protein SKIP14-like [Olea europaea var. sylvestris]
MALSQEENPFSEEKFEDGCSIEECLGRKGKNLGVEFKSEKLCEGIDDILPNDPFDMGVTLGLPNDPFGMDFNIGATVMAISGWIEDIEKNFGRKSSGFEMGEASGVKKDDNKLFSELNFILSSSMKFELEVGDEKGIDENSVDSDMDSDHGLYEHHYLLEGNTEESICFGCEKYSISSAEKKGNELVTNNNDGNEGAPPDALFFALGYLGVRDLLSVESVCKSLRDAIQNDPLLWREIRIDYPLNVKITDDALVRLTDRAQGSLHSLNLVNCFKIKDSGLKRVLEKHPRLTKLSVPGCIGLSIEGVLTNLKSFKSSGKTGIEILRIGEICSVKDDQLKELRLLLGEDKDKQRTAHKLHFYRYGQLYLSLEDECAIDVNVCPRCQHVRLVYDCPAKSCQQRPHTSQSCRGCTFCIPRCINCGRCLNDTDYEETFYLDLICLNCWMDILNCQDRVTLSPKLPYIHQQASYSLFIYD